MVEAHGGRISVDHGQRGTTFRVALPAPAAAVMLRGASC
jgi:signal transduction histidine kinase